jgi:tetratricopeptide (TPR) repeat protein
LRPQTVLANAHAVNPQAYDYYLRAKFHAGLANEPDLLYQCKYDQALAAFGDSSKFLPGRWASSTAWALFQLGRKEEAAARIEQFLRDHPQVEGGVLTGMEALIAASAGDARKAEQKIKRAVEIGKDYGHFHHTAYSIASAYALLNKRAEAIRWLQFAAAPVTPYLSVIPI